MAPSVVKKVRLKKAEAARLRRLAKALDLTESDILRKGIEAAGVEEERLRMRRENIPKLIAFLGLDGPDPPKEPRRVRPEGRVWDEAGRRVR